ncbi:hypothetical protein CSOJ01_10395 [Colletotrichum sojae]|uniref:Uncharacterized protein n=1 Tax=Colletotrichum sojae TaxID=2175907 RepID=A0A8H6J109_9PEZI|nr:hypothetical protein CSOJ01_10395 [Colletotrichum sojae]
MKTIRRRFEHGDESATWTEAAAAASRHLTSSCSGLSWGKRGAGAGAVLDPVVHCPPESEYLSLRFYRRIGWWCRTRHGERQEEQAPLCLPSACLRCHLSVPSTAQGAAMFGLTIRTVQSLRAVTVRLQLHGGRPPRHNLCLASIRPPSSRLCLPLPLPTAADRTPIPFVQPEYPREASSGPTGSAWRQPATSPGPPIATERLHLGTTESRTLPPPRRAGLGPTQDAERRGLSDRAIPLLDSRGLEPLDGIGQITCDMGAWTTNAAGRP